MPQNVSALQREPREPEATHGEALFGRNLDLVREVKVRLVAVVGECEITVGDFFELREGSVVKLDRRVETPVDVLLDGRRVARGTLVAVDDNFGVRITEIER